MITFESLALPDNTISHVGSLSVGIPTALSAAVGNALSVGVPVASSGSAGALLAPSVAVLEFGLPLFSAFEGVRGDVGSLSVGLDLAAIATPDAALQFGLPVMAEVYTPAIPSEEGVSIQLLTSPPSVLIYGGSFIADAVDTVTLGLLAEATVAYGIAERVILSVESFASQTVQLAASDTATFLSRVAVVQELAATDSMNMASLTLGNLRAVLQAASAVAASDNASTIANILALATSALMLADQPGIEQQLTADDALTLDELVQWQSTSLLYILDTVLATSTAEGVAVLLAEGIDSVEFSADGDGALSALLSALDNLDLALYLALPGLAAYATYTMNVETGGVTSYENFGFSSFANFNGVSLGTAEDGIYALDAADDDGAPIAARVRTGMTNFGDAREKQLPASYIGYTADGMLVLKVVTEKQGAKKENWYRLTPRQATAPTNNRWTPAKGLRSVYWGFEIANIDGADFEIDSLKIWPINHDRRK